MAANPREVLNRKRGMMPSILGSLRLPILFAAHNKICVLLSRSSQETQFTSLQIKTTQCKLRMTVDSYSMSWRIPGMLSKSCNRQNKTDI
jgi:hypothetical protein